MIDNSIIRIVYKDEKLQNKFYKLLRKINKIAIRCPTFMGIDFEFNTKKVALMQILFEVHKKTTIVKKYYIIYPPNLNQKTNDYLKYHIMANKNILKILHGSESLDIPYLVDDYFNMEIEPSIDFFLSMVDTRYLCEYLNILNSIRNPCKIYDLLVDLNIIPISEKKALELNEEKMGAIYDIIIDINSLTPELITYAIHDVVYLIDAYTNLQQQIIKTNPKDYYLLIDCLRFCFMEKRNITNIGDDIVIINMMNNYFYYINKANQQTKHTLDKILISTNTDTSTHTDKTEYYYRVSMIKTYDIIIKDYIESFSNIKFITNINYIKTNILNLLRTVVYVIILDNYKVKASNVQSVNYKINQNYKQITDSLHILDLNHLLELINHFYNYALHKIKP